ncbi:hypothetical protein Dsin_006641 [Dipteronia sinensis]|uniref:RNase H type-1 domain-containing protein n=1 Tax=Dipteronia sinensis TaxID=43782 RepID=A0AAE0EG32_9ROSI|nr:hypothetical protein Dsin_006641 [Dipteronia sinensis]
MNNCRISWSLPATDWVKLNVDSSMNPELKSISTGGVVRDHRKNWLIRFALNKGTGSVLEPKLWGILKGLNLVWQIGFRKHRSGLQVSYGQ